MAAVVVIGGGCGLRIEAYIVDTNLIRVSYHCISCYFTLKLAAHKQQDRAFQL